MTLKEQLHKIVDDLPGEDTIEAMQYRLYVLQKVRRGLGAIDQRRGIAHDQVVNRMRGGSSRGRAK
jgi:hypothetical protein